MNAARKFVLATLALLGLSLTTAQAGVFVGIGVPGPFYRHHYYRPYWGPRVVVGLPPIYIGSPPPPPVYVQPAPVYVQPAPQVIAPPPAQYVPPAPATQAPQAPPASPGSSSLPPAPIPVGSGR